MKKKTYWWLLSGIIAVWYFWKPKSTQQSTQRGRVTIKYNTVDYENTVRWMPLVKPYARDYNLKPTLILGMIYVESRGNPDATNIVENAVGLMQLRPIALADVNMSDIDRKNPRENVIAGIRYLDLLRRRKGSLNEAIKAYNNYGANYLPNVRFAQGFFTGQRNITGESYLNQYGTY